MDKADFQSFLKVYPPVDFCCVYGSALHPKNLDKAGYDYDEETFEKGSEWDFGVFSGLEGVEKPDPRIYEIALERAVNIAPEEVLHFGDSMRKDFVPAESVGMHALLLDRFNTPDAEEWRKSGAIVFPDLIAAKDWLASEKSSC